MNEFWISWSEDGLYVGKGETVNLAPLLWLDSGPIYQINSISLSTGWGTTGKWNIPIDKGSV